MPQQHDALTKAQGQLEAIKEDQREMQANVQRCKQEASQVSLLFAAAAKRNGRMDAVCVQLYNSMWLLCMCM